MAGLGYIYLFLALVASVYSALAHISGARGKHPALLQSARNSLLITFGLVSLSTAVLLNALVTHDFQIEYVASYTSLDTSLPYLFSALWAGNSGSLLFWAWLLSLFAVIAMLQRRDEYRELMPYASSIIMLIEAFFLILLLSVSNPFSKLSFVPPDGRGLNPMLENPGMIFHPPALLAGYVGLTIPFALAIAALLSGRLSNQWIIPVRRWMLLSWLLLGVGNLIGAWWAYVELGWGGYWAWDPVENAGLMPWLMATAFLHSTMMQRGRGMFKVWNMTLIIITFNLAIFGTFLTRSGVLSSVHTFGESRLGPFFLIFIGIALFGSLGLLYYHKNELKSEAEIEYLVSKEGTFLLNNLLLVGSTFAIFLGTVFPAISEVVRGVKIGVGTAYFNLVNGPIFLAIVLLAGICALIGWQQASIKKLLLNFLLPFIVALIIGLVLFMLGIRKWYAIVAFCLCGFVLSAILYQWFRETRTRHLAQGENYLKALGSLFWDNRPRYGGYIVHIGIILIATGVIGSSFYSVEKEATLKQGESMTIGKYTLTYNNINLHEEPSKLVATATLSIYNGQKLIGKLTPEKYFHHSYEQPVTEVAIHASLIEDLYVILIGLGEDSSAAFNVLVNPLVGWIWIGGGVFVLGGLVAYWPDRRKIPVPKRPVEERKRSTQVEEEIEKQVLELRRGKGRFCPKCGAKHQDDARFCPHCGAKLKQK